MSIENVKWDGVAQLESRMNAVYNIVLGPKDGTLYIHVAPRTRSRKESE